MDSIGHLESHDLHVYSPHLSLRLRGDMSDLNAKLKTALEGKAVAEARLLDFEKEKMMIELDIKEIIARHKAEVTDKMAWASKVCVCVFVRLYMYVCLSVSVVTVTPFCPCSSTTTLWWWRTS